MSDWPQIVAEGGPIVLRIAKRILGSLADAEDVAQEVFCQAFQLGQKQEISSWPALLRTLATRRSIDRLRRRVRLQSLDAELWTEDRPPIDEISNKELVARLRIALARLPVSCWESAPRLYPRPFPRHGKGCADSSTTSRQSTTRSCRYES